jgi:protocatechuate 3,4-dioxygenase, beta subunit
MSVEKPEHGSFFQRDREWHPRSLDPGYKSTVLRSPQRALISIPNTLSEITGPVFGHSILGPLDNDLIHNFAKGGESAIGPRIIVQGQVLDERGKPVPHVLLEVWQANAGGRYRHKREGYVAPLDPNFGGCGRVITDSAQFSPDLTLGPTASTTGGQPTFTFRSSDMVSRSA